MDAHIAAERAWIEAPLGCLQHDNEYGDALAELGNTVVIVLFTGTRPLLRCLSWYDLRAAIEQPGIPAAERVRFWNSDPIPSNYVHRIKDAWYDPMIDPLSSYYNTFAVVGSYTAVIGSAMGVSSLRNVQETIHRVRPLHRADVIAYAQGELSAAEFRARATATTGAALAAGSAEDVTVAAGPDVLPVPFRPRPGDVVTPSVRLSDAALYIGQTEEVDGQVLAYGYGETWQRGSASVVRVADGDPALPAPATTFTLDLTVPGRMPFRLTLGADGTVLRCVLVRLGVERPMVNGIDYPRTLYPLYTMGVGGQALNLRPRVTGTPATVQFPGQEMTPTLTAFANYLTRLAALPEAVVEASFHYGGAADVVMQRRAGRYYFVTMGEDGATIPLPAFDLARPVLDFTHQGTRYRLISAARDNDAGTGLALQVANFQQYEACAYRRTEPQLLFTDAIQQQLDELPLARDSATFARVTTRTGGRDYLLYDNSIYDTGTGNETLPVGLDVTGVVFRVSGTNYSVNMSNYTRHAPTARQPIALAGLERTFVSALRANPAFSYQSPGMRGGLLESSARHSFVDVYDIEGATYYLLEDRLVGSVDLLLRRYTLRLYWDGRVLQDLHIELPTPLPANPPAYVQARYAALADYQHYHRLLATQVLDAEDVLTQPIQGAFVLYPDNVDVLVTSRGVTFRQAGALCPAPDLARPQYNIVPAADIRDRATYQPPDSTNAVVDYGYKLYLPRAHIDRAVLGELQNALGARLRAQTHTATCHRPPPSRRAGRMQYVYYDGQMYLIDVLRREATPVSVDG